MVASTMEGFLWGKSMTAGSSGIVGDKSCLDGFVGAEASN
jgi:hypothetical protein